MDESVIAKLKGGLGNQLFIYFAAASLAVKKNAPLKMEISEIGNADTFREFALYNLNLPVPYQIIESRFSFRNKVLRKLTREIRDFRHRLFSDYIHTSSEIGYVNLDDLVSRSGNIYLAGYYQSWRYFSELEKMSGTLVIELKEESDWYSQHIERIQKQNVIAVHIRRGDFLKFRNSIGVLDLPYYREALMEARRQYPNSEVWAFSDDLSFIAKNKEFLGIDYMPESETNIPEIESLLLISRARVIITSNSTFSWWAATLSEKDTTVFCPSPWHKSVPAPADLNPAHWKVVNSTWL